MDDSEKSDRDKWDAFINAAKRRRKEIMIKTRASITMFEEMRDNGEPFFAVMPPLFPDVTDED